MAINDWSNVTKEHILQAIDIFLQENKEYPLPKTTFLVYEGKYLPAKHIRGMAYQQAFGIEISKQDYSGGIETVRFFEQRGFITYHMKSKVKTNGTKKLVKSTTTTGNTVKRVKGESFIENPLVDSTNEWLSVDKTNSSLKQVDSKIKIPSTNVIEQKNALQLLLNQVFEGDLVCEKTFSWLKTPKYGEAKYQKLFKELSRYRNSTSFAKENVQLRCDFVCESKKVIIEYDERQHFSEARRLSLLAYTDIVLNYDRDLWIRACSDIQAKDNNPANRDEVRAYYDSIRDIKAAEHGYRLIRIMHGQFDFTSPSAYEYLCRLLEIEANHRNGLIETQESNHRIPNRRKPDLKLGLYLQSELQKNKEDYRKAIKIAKDATFDILVFPEHCYTDFVDLMHQGDIFDSNDWSKILNECISLSEAINKAVIVSSSDSSGTIFSIYANANAKDVETAHALYVKHTMTSYSAFDSNSYQKDAEVYFEPIEYKGYTLGMTICYDCNNPLFSRLFGLSNVDLLINSTNGNVVYDKWYKYNKVRAIENSCFNLVTMGGEYKGEILNSYVFGFNRQGKELKPSHSIPATNDFNVGGTIYIYDLSKDDNQSEEDPSLNQEATVSKNGQLQIPVGNAKKILNQAGMIMKDLYVLPLGNEHLVICLIHGKEIMKPETVLRLLYAKELKQYENKRYLVINTHDVVDPFFYRNYLSAVLKVRTMENYCAVILQSQNINKCCQSGKNRTVQVVAETDGNFLLDLKRMSGPEAIWKNKESGMKASWRRQYEWLIEFANRLSDNES